MGPGVVDSVYGRLSKNILAHKLAKFFSVGNWCGYSVELSVV